jgi:hypothetical protein
MYAPDEFGQPRLRSGMITRSTLWRRNSNAWGAFALSIVGVGYFPECRLLQYLKGGFFATGESHLDANERVYRQFVRFEGPFSTRLANACRLEIVGPLLEEHGELEPELEILALDEDELADRAVPDVVTVEDVVRIEYPSQKGRLVSLRAQFDAVIGNSIRIMGCRLAGSEGRARLILPTSEGLALRPIQLEHPVEAEIIRRAEGFGGGGDPDAIVA